MQIMWWIILSCFRNESEFSPCSTSNDLQMSGVYYVHINELRILLCENKMCFVSLTFIALGSFCTYLIEKVECSL